MGGRFFVCPQPQNREIGASVFGSLTWIEVARVGSIPASGITTEFQASASALTRVNAKVKGASDAGGGPLECAMVPNDPGQMLLRAIGEPDNFNAYAFKHEHPDSGLVSYNRGFVAGPQRNGGRAEDFILETFELAFVQVEIVTYESA
jgi:hypothetical protein